MRLYRLLLRLYPAAFRAEYGAELRRVFALRRREAISPLSFWLGELCDVVWNATRAHWELLDQDLRYSLRTLRRSPGFAGTAVLVTALGVGANTAVFSVTDRVLFRPLPFADPERLVKLWEKVPGYTRMEPSPPNYLDWRRRATSFEAMAAYVGASVNLVGQGEPKRLEAAAVTADLLPMLGVTPVRGRLLGPEDERAGAPLAALLSYGLWQAEFGGTPDVIGKSVRLDDESCVVVGVLPAGFSFPDPGTRLWRPLRLQAAELQDRDDNFLKVVARLRQGVSLEQARAELLAITERLEREYPVENAETRASVVRLGDEAGAQARLLLVALFGASACVLLIACSNLAGLLLARALSRRRELAVRVALGAGRERLVRQLLTESLVLAVVGGALGVLLALGVTPLLARLVPASLPLPPPTAIDARVLLFATLLTLLTGIAFGVVPAWRSCAGAELAGLRKGSRGGLGGSRERLRFALVLAEVAGSLALLVASGLLIRALWRVQAVDPGFRTEGVMTLRTPLPGRYASTALRARLYERVLTEIRALPGVAHAAYISFLPMVMRGGIWPVQIGVAPADRRDSQTASLRFVTPGFFASLDIPLRQGRDVGDGDTREAPAVAVVSESFVRRYWPGESPLGRRFTFAFAERTVVGVVGDIRVRGLEGPSEPQVYLPYRQVPDGGLGFYTPKDLVIRSASAPETLVADVRRIVRNADPELPISDVRTLQDVVDADTAPRRTQIRALALFAAVSLLLTGIGIHGLLSYAVSQRIPEIGLRLALGAQPRSILKMVLGDGVRLAGIGGLVGLLLAYLAGRALEALLFGVTPIDLVSYAAGAGIVAAMTLTGTLAPALRALRVDPTIALRAET